MYFGICLINQNIYEIFEFQICKLLCNLNFTNWIKLFFLEAKFKELLSNKVKHGWNENGQQQWRTMRNKTITRPPPPNQSSVWSSLNWAQVALGSTSLVDKARSWLAMVKHYHESFEIKPKLVDRVQKCHVWSSLSDKVIVIGRWLDDDVWKTYPAIQTNTMKINRH